MMKRKLGSSAAECRRECWIIPEFYSLKIIIAVLKIYTIILGWLLGVFPMVLLASSAEAKETEVILASLTYHAGVAKATVWYKPSTSATPTCSECQGQGIWKEKYCVKCGGKGVGSFYLPYACSKLACGCRTRTNWEAELHFALEHAGKPVIPDHHVMATQPFLLPIGRKWASSSPSQQPLAVNAFSRAY